MKIEGKNVFITGAAQGLGEGISEALLERGARVFIADINGDKGQETVKRFQDKYGEEKAFFLKADVTKADEFESTFKDAVSRFGHIDIMINNAGIMDESRWELMISLNVTTLVRGTNLAIEHMDKLKGGKGGLIVNTASVAGLGPGFWFPVYCGTKSAVIGFTTSWAANPHVEAMGIKFACLCPSAADTSLIQYEDHMGIMISHFKKFLEETVKIAPVSKIVEGYMALIEKDDNNGALVVVGEKEGIKFVDRYFNPGSPKENEEKTAKEASAKTES